MWDPKAGAWATAAGWLNHHSLAVGILAGWGRERAFGWRKQSASLPLHFHLPYDFGAKLNKETACGELPDWAASFSNPKTPNGCTAGTRYTSAFSAAPAASIFTGGRPRARGAEKPSGPFSTKIPL